MNWQMMFATRHRQRRRLAQKPLSRLSVFLSYSPSIQWFKKHDKSFEFFGKMNLSIRIDCEQWFHDSNNEERLSVNT